MLLLLWPLLFYFFLIDFKNNIKIMLKYGCGLGVCIMYIVCCCQLVKKSTTFCTFINAIVFQCGMARFSPVSSFLGLLDMSSRCSGLSKQKVWPSSQAGRFRRANSPRALCPPGSFRCWDKARSAQGNLCSFSCKAFSPSAQ